MNYFDIIILLLAIVALEIGGVIVMVAIHDAHFMKRMKNVLNSLNGQHETN